MPLTPTFTITQQDGGDTAIGVNTTTYGGANQDRDEAAEIVLWSKTAQNGTRVFTNPDQGNVLTNLQYALTTAQDGWYELIRVRVQFYDAGANYVNQQESAGVITRYPSIIYDESSEKFYKSIVSSSGQSPLNPTYFTEIPLDDLKDHLDNTNIEVYYKDWNREYDTNGKLRDRFASSACTCAPEKRDYNQTLLYMKQSADTNFVNGNPEIFEKIIRDLEIKLAQ